MTPSIALQTIIRPTLALLGSKYQSADAERMLLAISLQESNLQHRTQVGGPARGWWQFERGGGVRGVLTHSASRGPAAELCAAMLYPATAADVYRAIADNDVLACGFARLLLWTDPDPLPTASGPGWDYYQRNWRPGKPHPEKWPECWRIASDTVK